MDRRVETRPLERQGHLRWHRFPVRALVGALLSVVVWGGCRTVDETTRSDAEILRSSAEAKDLFQEGWEGEAGEHYRAALKRAWALDDAREIAHASYNLAAVRTTEDRLIEARDWLAEARAEFQRAGESGVQTWLLEAKIAQRMGMFEDAALLTCQARDVWLCWRRNVHDESPSWHDRIQNARCEGGTLEKLPGIGKIAAKRMQKRRERATFDTQVDLIDASLACDMCDLCQAESKLMSVERQLPYVCDLEVCAEAENVSGRFHMIANEPQLAGESFDAEAELLRRAENYRLIPGAYEAAAAAYGAAGMFDVAAERYFRSARMLYARNQLQLALEVLGRSLEMAEVSCDVAVQTRLALLFGEINKAVQAAGESENRPATDLNE